MDQVNLGSQVPAGQAVNQLLAQPKTELTGQEKELQAKLAAAQDGANAPKEANIRKFYSRLDGACYYFADGTKAVFTGGVLVVDVDNPTKGYSKEQWQKRIDELEAACNVPGQPVFYFEPVPVLRSDSLVLREIGAAGGGVAAGQQSSGVGMLNSQLLGQLAQR